MGIDAAGRRHHPRFGGDANGAQLRQVAARGGGLGDGGEGRLKRGGAAKQPRPRGGGKLNLWRGFAVEPRPGDCSKFLAHVRDNVCGGDENLYRWVIGWLAQIVQHPDKKIGTSLVLRGPQGVGKTKVW